MNTSWLLLVCVLGFVQKTDCFESCPKWMCKLKQVDNYWVCKCPWFCGINCRRSEVDSVNLCDGFCLGYDNSTDRVVSGFCPFSYQQSEYFKYSNSDTIAYEDLNEVMCGQLNREGLFCSNVKLVTGSLCSQRMLTNVLNANLSLTGFYTWPCNSMVPLTFFYLLVIVFNFSATKPPLTAYIFYCQLFTQIPDTIPFIKNLFKHNTNQSWFLYVTWTVCDIWNLDVLRYVIPPFCLDENLGAIELICYRCFWSSFVCYTP